MEVDKFLILPAPPRYPHRHLRGPPRRHRPRALRRASKLAKPGKAIGQETLQSRYAETKDAAERYEILQIGLTCVEQDLVGERYILKPYNFNLSPLIDERRLDIERDFSFHSGAVEFLLKSHFDIGQGFERGVPYLSRAKSRERHAKRQDCSPFADLEIKPTDTEALTFLERGYIQIVGFDQEREDKHLQDRKRELEECIGRQKGFRRIIEALLGGDVTQLQLRDCTRDPVTGNLIFVDQHELKTQLSRAQDRIHGNPRMLMGHNGFLDLVYLYHTFIEPLPTTVEEFQAKLHKIWPCIVDTKYMSTP